MRFDRYFHIFTTLLTATGFYSILITGSYLLPVLWGLVITAIYGVLGERRFSKIPIPKWVWNGIAITLLFYLGFDSFFGQQDLVGNGVKFVVYLQIVKLLSPKANRDYLQIYLLSFLHILASTVISSDLSFALPFLLYVVLATWTLTLFNLKQASEKSGMASGLLSSTSVITRKYLSLTSVLSISLIGVTLLVFFSFPRVSFGNFLKRVDSRQNVSGFSENVVLGTIGTIKTNSQIVLRVEMSPETLNSIDTEHLYWRGTASNVFDGHRWKQSYDNHNPIHLDTESGVVSLQRKNARPGKRIQYRVFLEALSPPMLFGADSLFRMTWDKTLIERLFRNSMNVTQDLFGGLYLGGVTTYVSDLTYTAESTLENSDAEKLKKETGAFPQWAYADYTELPTLTDNVRKVLDQIPVQAGHPYETAQSVVNFLEQNYRYTLDVQDAGVKDPLEFFLVDRKKGHCEYFSTALAIALRYHGIPSREVVGFRGGELNLYGGYIAVRQSDAHTWVEAYMPESGWIRLDPSPLDSTIRSRSQRFQALNQFVDFIRLRWNKYIIEYDLRAQVAFAERIGRNFRSLTGRSSSSKTLPTEKELPTVSTQNTYRQISVLAFAFFFVGLAMAIYLRRSKRQTSGFDEIFSLLRTKGYEREPHETISEFCNRVRKEKPKLKTLERLNLVYYDERFGASPKELKRWKMLSETFKSELLTYR